MVDEHHWGMNETEFKIRILLVDDDVRILRFLRISLVGRGYEVLTAGDGEEALAVIRAKDPNLIVLDILLPKKDGFGVLEELRRFSATPVIAMSAHTTLAEKALSLGANDFISKPFSLEELREKIESALANSHGTESRLF